MSRYLAIAKRYHGSPEGASWDEEQLAETVRNLLALSSDQRDAYRRELALAAPEDPWLEFDREALRRLDAIVNKGKIP